MSLSFVSRLGMALAGMGVVAVLAGRGLAARDPLMAAAAPVLRELASPALAANPSLSSQSGLVAHWQLDDGSGTAGTDASASANHLALMNGAQWTTGRSSTGVQLDGMNDYLVSSRSVLDPATTDFSAVLWVKLNATGRRQALIAQEDGAGKGRVWLWVTSNNRLGSFLGAVDPEAATVLAPATWHHVALVKSGSTLAFYLNGVLDGQASPTVEPANGSTRLGASKFGAPFFAGALDDVRIYNTALARELIRDMYLSASTQPPSGTPGPTPTSTLIAIPSCPHNPSLWHSLVERNSDGSVACTYGHEHKDDPRALNFKFGSLSPEIDYAWHAFNTRTGNPEDHRTFNWSVVNDVACKAQFAKFSFNKLRLQTHAGYNGATIRDHSYFLQAAACDPADPTWQDGTITVGGWLDFGKLKITGGAEVSVPDQDTIRPIQPAISGNRTHGAPPPASPAWNFTWYGRNVMPDPPPSTLAFSCLIGVVKEEWGYIDPSDPLTRHFYGGNFNGSWHEPVHLIDITVPPWLDPLDGATDGYVTYNGWTDRWGNIVSNCGQAGLDCVPLKLNRMKLGTYQFRADEHGLAAREYDVKVDGQTLIQFPN